LAIHGGDDLGSDCLVGITGQQSAAVLATRLTWRGPIRLSGSGWFGFCPFEGGRLDLYGVSVGSFCLAPNSAVRYSAASRRCQSAKIRAFFSACLRSGRGVTPRSESSRMWSCRVFMTVQAVKNRPRGRHLTGDEEIPVRQYLSNEAYPSQIVDHPKYRKQQYKPCGRRAARKTQHRTAHRF